MDGGNLEKECSAIGGLFQQIISDLKNGTPIWEDLISKATKLHTCLRATIHAIAAYLDAFQKIADAATNTRGATKDIGSALTRICLRQKAVEARMKTFTSALMDCLVVPLQEKLEEWKKSVLTLDKEHARGKIIVGYNGNLLTLNSPNSPLTRNTLGPKGVLNYTNLPLRIRSPLRKTTASVMLVVVFYYGSIFKSCMKKALDIL
uniref:Metastasis suppressor protein 1 n=1 Tax=Cacopsylla melanoneura TaxID=428564 RepID=A0A8D9F0Z1_9HEMI